MFKAAVGNFEEREDLASNLKKYNCQIPPPPSPLHSCPASKVPPPEEADVHATMDVHAIGNTWTTLHTARYKTLYSDFHMAIPYLETQRYELDRAEEEGGGGCVREQWLTAVRHSIRHNPGSDWVFLSGRGGFWQFAVGAVGGAKWACFFLFLQITSFM